MTAQHTPHPVQTLNSFCKHYPDLTQQVNAAWSKKLADPRLWPDWCLLPMDEWARIIDRQESKIGIVRPMERKLRDCYFLAMLGTWRYSQGIYRIDSDFQKALLDSEPGKNIPADILLHMPEWSIYVETPGESWQDDTALWGFWASIAFFRNLPYPKLQIAINTCDGVRFTPDIPLGEWTVEEALNREMWDIDKKTIPACSIYEKIEREINFSKWRGTRIHIERLLHIILYCCCDKPDIDDARQPGTSPQRPQAKQVKGGLRLFPASAPRFWTVGNNIGERLRQAQQDNQEKETSCGSGRSRRPHLRRGHWHGYWTGPRKSEVPQKFILHWIPPQLIRGSGEVTLQGV